MAEKRTPSPAPAQAAGSLLARYRGMIVSIAVFLILLTVMMAASIFLSRQVQQDTAQLYAVSQMEKTYLDNTQYLQNLKLNENEDPNSAYNQGTLQKLKQGQATLANILSTLKSGGSFTDATGRTLEVEALSGTAKQALIGELEQKWQSISADIDKYTATASRPDADGSVLDRAILNVRNNEARILEVMDFAILDAQNTAQNRSNQLSQLQTIGIVAALLYFLVFLLYFIRQLLQSDRAAEAARNETTEIMDTVTSGLFLLDKDLNIGSQYSKELENLLGQKNVGGKNLLDVLGGMLNNEDLNTTYSFIKQLYNPRTKERLIRSLNPLTRQAVTIDGKEQYLDFNFNRVYKGKDISRVLVNVENVTDAVLLEQKIEQEREQNDVQIEMLSTILQADRGHVNDFVRNVNDHIQTINAILKAPGEDESALRDKAIHIFRAIHSLKGEASALKLNGFTVMAENLENDLSRLRSKAKLSGEDFLGLAVHLEELIRLNHTIGDLISRIGISPAAGTGTSATHAPAASAAPAGNSGRYGRFVADIAQRQGKKAVFSHSGLEQTGRDEIDRTIGEIAIQLLRNAVVHGIETPEIRQSRHKLPTGHVRMDLYEQDGAYHLDFEDDGNGIDYRAIADKAVKLGRYSAAQAEQLDKRSLLALLFSPGFSTLDESGDDAGRGIGLDIIKDRISALGGKVRVSSKPHAYTRFSFTIPK